jgi:hypothetical protein
MQTNSQGPPNTLLHLDPLLVSHEKNQKDNQTPPSKEELNGNPLTDKKDHE